MNRREYLLTSCVACGRLHWSLRADALTHSGACRFWLLKHPEVREGLEDYATKLEVERLRAARRAGKRVASKVEYTPGAVLRLEAVLALAPDLREQVLGHSMTLAEAETVLRERPVWERLLTRMLPAGHVVRGGKLARVPHTAAPRPEDIEVETDPPADDYPMLDGLAWDTRLVWDAGEGRRVDAGDLLQLDRERARLRWRGRRGRGRL